MQYLQRWYASLHLDARMCKQCLVTVLSSVRDGNMVFTDACLFGESGDRFQAAHRVTAHKTCVESLWL